MTNRFSFIIEYNGTNYCGWQRQTAVDTIQQTLENILSNIVKHPVVLHVAGRTDAGVHASAQVAHADLIWESENTHKLIESINHFCKGKGIAVIKCCKVASDFHARFSAIGREYHYYILNRQAPPVTNPHVWHMRKALNLQAMQKGATYLIGYHDFSSFRDSACQAKSPLKTIESIEITKHDDLIITHLKAPSFLHHQVRIIMGTLKLIGDGTLEPCAVKKILQAKNRAVAGPTAPPQGLFLSKVIY